MNKMNELDRLATTGKMMDQGMAPQGMPMAPQGMPMAPAPQGMSMAPAPQGMKKGGAVSKVLNKAGFYDKGKTKSERKKIVSKVTTKPQRLGMVEKMFSAKKMKAGGTVSSASKRGDGCAVKGKTKGRMV